MNGPTIAEIRKSYPQYGDFSDEELGSALHQKYYSDMPKEEFFSKIGIAQDTQAKEQEIKNVIKEDKSLLQELDLAARNNPIIQGMAEFQSGINRGALGLIDFFTTDQLNSILEISGSEKRVPTLRSLAGGTPEVEGGFMEEGLAKDIVGTSGEFAPAALSVGSASRYAASSLPRMAQGESAAVGTVRELGRATPTMDVATAGMSAAGGEFGEEVGGDAGKVVGGFAAPMVGVTALRGGQQLASAAKEKIPQELDDAMARGRVMTTDIRQPKTFITKSLQRLGERVPYAGTGAVRASQQGDRQQAVRDFAGDFGVSADDAFEQQIVGAAKTTFKDARRRASKLRTEAIAELNKGGNVSTEKTKTIILEEIEKQKALGKKADKELIKSLQDTLESLDGDFQHVANIRTAVLNEISDIGARTSAIRSGGDASLERVRGALSKDLGDFAQKYSSNANGEGAKSSAKWKASNRIFADGFEKARDTELKRIFTKGEITPELVANIVRGGKRSELKRLYDYSGIDGRKATRQLIIQEAIEKSGGFNNVNPTQLLNRLNQKNARTATDMFFKGVDKRELDGFKKYLDLTRRAQEANVATPTGQEAVTLATGAGAFAEPTVVLPLLATTAGGSRLFESKQVRNLMIKLSVAKNKEQQLSVYNKLEPLILQMQETEK